MKRIQNKRWATRGMDACARLLALILRKPDVQTLELMVAIARQE